MVTWAIVFGILMVLILVRRAILWKTYSAEIAPEIKIQDQPESSVLIYPNFGSSGIVPGGVSYTQPQKRWGKL